MYAGVLAFRDNQVALVREHYELWETPHWTIPSGGIEPGESPAEGATRELREETGLLITPPALTLFAEVTVASHDRSEQSTSWNYFAHIPDGDFLIADPDGSIQEAKWFPLAEAADLLAQLPYPPIAVPTATHLRTPSAGLTRWTFTYDPTIEFNNRTYGVERTD